MIKEAVRPYAKFVQEFNLLVDEPMEKYTSFKIGGIADLLALPENKMELKNLIKTEQESL